MGLAPEPGVGRRAAQTEVAKAILTITYDGEPLSLAWQNVPMGERLACRKATGMPLESLTSQLSELGANQIGEDSLFVLWWLARRARGEAGLDFDKAIAEWDPLKLGAVTVDTPDPKGEDPEA